MRYFVTKTQDKSCYKIVNTNDNDSEFTVFSYRAEDASLMCEVLNNYHNGHSSCDRSTVLAIALLITVCTAINYGFIKLLEYALTN